MTDGKFWNNAKFQVTTLQKMSHARARVFSREVILRDKLSLLTLKFVKKFIKIYKKKIKVEERRDH